MHMEARIAWENIASYCGPDVTARDARTIKIM
jgi:hypothetical protein